MREGVTHSNMVAKQSCEVPGSCQKTNAATAGIDEANEKHPERITADLSAQISKLREDLLQQMQQQMQQMQLLEERISIQIAKVSLKMELHEDGLAMLKTQQSAQAAGVGTGGYVPESRGFGPVPGSSLSLRSRWRRTWFYGH